MSSQSHGWSKFVKRININADPQTIYNAWCTQAAIESWFLRQSIFSTEGSEKKPEEAIQAGDAYEWRWHGYGDEVTERGEIISANGKDMLQFTFAGDCLVTVRSYLEDGESIAELTQENIPKDDNPATNLYVGCGEGWTFYLANLKSVLEGGLDLRNKNLNIKKVINS
jgi:uncharacterized protein YndB with AHSA1/START domain